MTPRVPSWQDQEWLSELAALALAILAVCGPVGLIAVGIGVLSRAFGFSQCH